MVCNADCPTCKSACEDTKHTLWNCQQSWVIWDVDEELKKCFKHRLSLFANLLEMIFLRKERVDVNFFAIIIWLIWNLRNIDRLGEPTTKANMIQTKAGIFVQDFQTAQSHHVRPPTELIRAARWIPTISPHYKINFDVAIFNEVGAAGLGVVVRDSYGCVIVALSERIPILTFAATVEVLACRRALIFAKE